MTKILQKKIVKITCPHCRHEMNEAWICEMNSIIGLRFAYICSNCEKLLGILESSQSVLIQRMQSGSFAKN